MHKIFFKYILLITLGFGFCEIKSQTELFKELFSKNTDFIIIPKENTNFKEYYEITIPQFVDHTNTKDKFDQRIYVGINDIHAPNILITDGYAIDYASKPAYNNELATELNANLITVEHRFFGKSIPNNIEWNNLTVKQAAEDYHYIKSILDPILKGKWIASGISKGGQAALGYKLFYPNDVAAVVVYGTAIKNKQTVYTDSILFPLSKTECGKKVNEFQLYLFKHKSDLLPLFNNYSIKNNFDYTPLSTETVLDYLLLEYPFSFWQNGNKCEDLPDTSVSAETLFTYLIKVVPPRFFSTRQRPQLEPAFYMFYNELGYYEYNTKPFKKYLQQNNYSNNYFTPKNTSIQFNKEFQQKVNTFIQSKASDDIFFIYGEYDPWALQTIISKNVFRVSQGSHKSKIADLNKIQKTELYNKLKILIK